MEQVSTKRELEIQDTVIDYLTKGYTVTNIGEVYKGETLILSLDIPDSMGLVVPPKFEIDHREAKPAAHALYVLRAIESILIIDQSIKRVEDRNSVAHNDMLIAMYAQRSKLFRDNAAYFEAKMFLENLAKQKLITKDGDIFIAFVRERS